MRAVFRILRLALGGEGRLGEVAGEQQSCQQADAQNVEARRAPDQSGNEQQSVPPDLHGWFSLCDRAAAVDAFPGHSPATAVLS